MQMNASVTRRRSGRNAVSGGKGPSICSPCFRATSIAGIIIRSSSRLPNNPCSPACGFSPQTTSRGVRDRLTPTQTPEADYDISGFVSDYTVTTSGISNQQAATNRLTVTIHLVFQNKITPDKSFEADVSRNFEFSASLSLSQAEAQLGETIVRNMVDEMFNRIFSNW